jgi:hypothetical protein
MKLLITTLHQKGALLQPLFAQFGLQLSTNDSFDTNKLGTFSKTVERRLAPPLAALEKAKAGYIFDQTADWYIGSEGSFFPHPSIPWVTLNQEVLVAWSANEDRQITVIHSAVAQGVFSLSISNEKELNEFVRSHPFEQIGLLITTEHQEPYFPEDISELLSYSYTCFSKGQSIHIEPDVRAHRHSFRRSTILEAGGKLAKRLTTACPSCSCIGFGEERKVIGLPCGWCGQPTTQVREIRIWCTECSYEESLDTSNIPISADPSNCFTCNP